jgi:hypothetical protein
VRLRQDRGDDVKDRERGRRGGRLSVLDDKGGRVRERATIDAEGMGCLMRKVNEDALCLSTLRTRSEQADEREKDAPKSV